VTLDLCFPSKLEFEKEDEGGWARRRYDEFGKAGTLANGSVAAVSPSASALFCLLRYG
jgi:hypothetical protein